MKYVIFSQDHQTRLGFSNPLVVDKKRCETGAVRYVYRFNDSASFFTQEEIENQSKQFSDYLFVVLHHAIMNGYSSENHVGFLMNNVPHHFVECFSQNYVHEQLEHVVQYAQEFVHGGKQAAPGSEAPSAMAVKRRSC